MKIPKTIAALLAVTAINTIAVHAQTQELFRAQINVTCRPGLSHKNDKMTNRDFIRQCVGDGFTRKEINRNFRLVFNTASDSLQVVNTEDGSVVCDVFEFQGGTNVLGNSQLQRFVFVFVPGKSDAVGSAVITERVRGNGAGARINGKIQFARSEPTGDGTTGNVSISSVTVSSNNGDTNVFTSDQTGSFVQSVPILATASEVQVCSGTFTIGAVFVPGQNVQSTQLTNRQRRQLQQQQQNQSQTTGTTTNTTITGTITNSTGSVTNFGNGISFGSVTNFGNATVLNSVLNPIGL